MEIDKNKRIVLPPIMNDYVQKFITDVDKNRFIELLIEGYYPLVQEYYYHNVRVYKEKSEA